MKAVYDLYGDNYVQEARYRYESIKLTWLSWLEKLKALQYSINILNVLLYVEKHYSIAYI